MGNHNHQLLRAVSYIEATRSSAFCLEAAAREAGMSPFHFSRVFHSVTGEPVSEYARKRRLTAAADMLIATRMPLVDVALSVGFESQEAFTRAFKRWYSVTPARFRKNAMPYMLRDSPMLTREALESFVAGCVAYEPRFVERGDATFVGLACDNTMGRIGIPRLWGAFLRRMGEIEGQVDASTYGIYGYDYSASVARIGESFLFRYLASVETRAGSAQAVPAGMESWSVSSMRYAVFVHRGYLRDLGLTYSYIYKTWFARQSFGFAAAPFFERRAPDYPGDKDGAETEIWIPIEAKGEQS